MCSLCIASLRGPPIGGQENDRVSNRCFTSYTLSRCAGIPLKGKREGWRGKTESHIFHVPFRSFPPLVVNAVSQSPECVSCHMTYKVNPVTLTLYSSPAGRYHNPRPEGPSNLRTLRTSGRSILRTFPFTTLLHNPPPTGGHNPRAGSPSTLTPQACPVPRLSSAYLPEE